ncbi:HNH endonuclease [Luteitalea sp.]
MNVQRIAINASTGDETMTPEIRCLLCSRDAPPTSEHMFPEALGYFVELPILCRACNNHLGATVDVAADRDAPLTQARRWAGLPLRPQAARHVAPARDTAGRLVEGCVTSDGRLVAATKYVDGELFASEDVLETEIARSIKGKARQAGEPYHGQEAKAAARAAMEAFRKAPVGATIRGGYRALTFSVHKHKVDASTVVRFRDEPDASDRLFAKIALEFLAMTIADTVLLQLPYFDAAREFVLHGRGHLAVWDSSLPWPQSSRRRHELVAENSRDKARVSVTLFGGYTRVVEFGRAIPGLPAVWLRRRSFDVPPARRSS